METSVQQDIGEEIISKLKELTRILEKIRQEVENGQKRTLASSSRN